MRSRTTDALAGSGAGAGAGAGPASSEGPAGPAGAAAGSCAGAPCCRMLARNSAKLGSAPGPGGPGGWLDEAGVPARLIWPRMSAIASHKPRSSACQPVAPPGGGEPGAPLAAGCPRGAAAGPSSRCWRKAAWRSCSRIRSSATWSWSEPSGTNGCSRSYASACDGDGAEGSASSFGIGPTRSGAPCPPWLERVTDACRAAFVFAFVRAAPKSCARSTVRARACVRRSGGSSSSGSGLATDPGSPPPLARAVGEPPPRDPRWISSGSACPRPGLPVRRRRRRCPRCGAARQRPASRGSLRGAHRAWRRASPGGSTGTGCSPPWARRRDWGT